MRRLRTMLILAALSAGAGVAAYQILLTEEARASLRRSASQVKDTVETLNDKLGEHQNIDIDRLPNRQRTNETWDALGY